MNTDNFQWDENKVKELMLHFKQIEIPINVDAVIRDYKLIKTINK